jgi:hypothetical protein
MTSQPEPFTAALGRYRTQSGTTLLEVSRHAPVLVVFLRHFG